MNTPKKTPVKKLSNLGSNNPKEQSKWLLDKIESSIEYVQSKRFRFQKLASYLRLLTLTLSALLTVALGLRWEEYKDELRNLAFVIGATITTISSLDLYFNLRSLWVEHEETKWRLHRLKDRIEFYLAGRPDDEISTEDMANFHEAYQWIWDNLSANWLNHRRDSD